MNQKTIAGIIRRKVADWLKSMDPAVADKIKDDIIVTGGCLTSLWRDEEVNDFDIYFGTRLSAFEVASYYVTKFAENPPLRFQDRLKLVTISVKAYHDRVKIYVKSAGVASAEGTPDSGGYQYFEGVEEEQVTDDYVKFVTRILSTDRSDSKAPPESTDASDAADLHFADQVKPVETVTEDPDTAKPKQRGRPSRTRPPYWPIYLSPNAITLTDRIQVVTRFFGTPAELHKNFDFVHCTAYWSSATNTLVMPAEMMEAAHNRELKYVGSLYPITSVIRTRKFLKRGWNINAGQFVKMAFQINHLDLDDMRVLEDQLLGVDAAYFVQLLVKIAEAKKDPSVTVDHCYVIKLLEEMFG